MKKLTKSRRDKKIASVCGGIAEYFGIDSTIVRIGLIIFCCMGGSGLLAYILAACVMPEEEDYIDYQD
ncbi:MAG: PspC domain-containing protein [Lachnospiraceae bacterium]|nr:PspC domain-containing protein [Lachnospiraceae bacterium]